MKALIVIGACVLVLGGLWLSWFVGSVQDRVDRRYIDADES